jgi:tRNA G10  N-methylase Trm11
MRLFYSTCPAGLEEPARRLAEKVVPGFSVKAVMSGAVLYAAKVERPECAGFTNTYLQIARLDRCGSVAHAAKLFLAERRALSDAERAMREYGFESFRAMFADANKLEGVEKEYREAFEHAIRVRNDRMNPQTELLALRRSEGSAMLLLRLTKPRPARKGELSPAVASCMAFLAKPEPGGSFLDPFAGSGAIGVARMSLGKSKRVFLSDADENAVKKLKNRIPSRAEIEKLDATRLAERFAEGEFTEIATDPPWGLYKPLNGDPATFARQVVESLAHILAPYGTLVILSAMKDEFGKALKDSALDLQERYDILVNGKKAAIFVARK